MDKSFAGRSAIVYQLHNNDEIIVHEKLTVDTDGKLTVTVDKLSSFAVAVKDSTNNTDKTDTNKTDTGKTDMGQTGTNKSDTGKADEKQGANAKQTNTDAASTNQSNVSQANTKTTAPVTGDGANLVFWIAAAALSAAGILAEKRYHRDW